MFSSLMHLPLLENIFNTLYIKIDLKGKIFKWTKHRKDGSNLLLFKISLTNSFCRVTNGFKFKCMPLPNKIWVILNRNYLNRKKHSKLKMLVYFSKYFLNLMSTSLIWSYRYAMTAVLGQPNTTFDHTCSQQVNLRFCRHCDNITDFSTLYKTRI